GDPPGPVAEGAAGTAFPDQSQFSRHFNRLIGVTPRQFPMSARNPRPRTWTVSSASPPRWATSSLALPEPAPTTSRNRAANTDDASDTRRPHPFPHSHREAAVNDLKGSVVKAGRGAAAHTRSQGGYVEKVGDLGDLGDHTPLSDSPVLLSPFIPKCPPALEMSPFSPTGSRPDGCAGR